MKITDTIFKIHEMKNRRFNEMHFSSDLSVFSASNTFLSFDRTKD